MIYDYKMMKMRNSARNQKYSSVTMDMYYDDDNDFCIDDDK